MSRVPVHDSATVPAASKEALQGLEARFGKVLNIFGSMAHSPALLNAYAAYEQALAEHGTLTEGDKQAVRLAVAARQGCDYCQSAYTMAGRAAGLTEEETVEIRAGTAAFDRRLDALVRLAVELFDGRGHVSDATWRAALDAEWRDDQLLEVHANVTRTFLTTGLNRLVGTELDVPPAPGIDR